MKNILLLSLSTLNTKKPKSNYKLEDEPELEYTSGFQTNEGWTKMMIQKMKVQRIICISSKTVREKKIGENVSEVKINKEFKETDYEEFKEKTAYEYYEFKVKEFAMEMGYTDEELANLVCPIPIENDPTVVEVQTCVIRAMDEIISDSKDECNVYIDANGGQRHISTILIAISRLAKLHNIKIKGIYTTRYDHAADDKELVYPIVNSTEAYDIFNLVSGIDEFVHYGRTSMLQSLFEGKSDDIDNILKYMRAFSNSLLMCQSGLIQNNIKQLKKRIDTFLSKSKTEKEKVFAHVLSYICYGYKDIFKSNDLITVIRWCLKKGYLQQAVTFYVERLPNEIVSREILYVSDELEEEYNQAREDKKTSYHYKNCEYNYGLLVKFLPHKYGRFNLVKHIDQKKLLTKLNYNTSENKRKVKDILKSYYDIKDDRNKINHASENNLDIDFIEKTTDKLNNELDSLQKIMANLRE